MPRPPYRGTHLRQRAAWAALINSGQTVNCYRCHQPIAPGDRFDLDHIVAVSNGGAAGPSQPSHRDCNRRHGAQLAAAAMTAAPRRSRQPPAAPPSCEWFPGCTEKWERRCREAGWDPTEVRANPWLFLR
jgi:HNH endonuclease